MKLNKLENSLNNKPFAQKHTHFAAALSQPASQSRKKSMLFPIPEKLKTKNFLPFKKIKLCNRTAHDRQTRTCMADTWTTQHLQTFHSDTDDRKTEALGGNIGLPTMAGTVANSAFAHLINFRAWGQVSASKSPLRQAKNRYSQW